MRRTSMRLFAMFGLAASLVACGNDSTPGPGADTSSPTDTADTTADTTSDTQLPPSDTAVPDTTTTLDTTQPDTTTPDTNTPDTTPDTTDTTAPTCSRNGFDVLASYLEYDAEYDYTNFGVENDTAFISVEFYDFGNGSPLTGVGIYPIGGNADDRNYETCETCVLIYADCGEEDCAKVFYATGGSIEVSAIDQTAGTITAKLKNIVAVEVTIDSQSFRSTPVANGETYCIDTVDVDYN